MNSASSAHQHISKSSSSSSCEQTSTLSAHGHIDTSASLTRGTGMLGSSSTAEEGQQSHRSLSDITGPRDGGSERCTQRRLNPPMKTQPEGHPCNSTPACRQSPPARRRHADSLPQQGDGMQTVSPSKARIGVQQHIRRCCSILGQGAWQRTSTGGLSEHRISKTSAVYRARVTRVTACT